MSDYEEDVERIEDIALQAKEGLSELDIDDGDLPKIEINPFDNYSYGDSSVVYVENQDTLLVHVDPNDISPVERDVILQEFMETLSLTQDSSGPRKSFDSDLYLKYSKKAEYIPKEFRPYVPGMEDVEGMYEISKLMREKGRKVESIFDSAEKEIKKWENKHEDSIEPIDELERLISEEDTLIYDLIETFNGLERGSEKHLEDLVSENGKANSIVMRNSPDAEKAEELIQRIQNSFDEIEEYSSKMSRAGEHLERAIEYERKNVTEERFDPLLVGVSELMGPVFNGNIKGLDGDEEFLESLEKEYNKETAEITSRILENMDISSEHRLEEFGKAIQNVKLEYTSE